MKLVAHGSFAGTDVDCRCDACGQPVTEVRGYEGDRHDTICGAAPEFFVILSPCGHSGGYTVKRRTGWETLAALIAEAASCEDTLAPASATAPTPEP